MFFALLLFSPSIASAAEVPYELYSRFFPLHAEYCSGSKLDYRDGRMEDGGYGGHALLYVNGLCKDYSVNYPRVIPCAQLKNPDHAGVGVNVNGDYKNVNWVAVPGREFFFNGGFPSSVLVDDGLVKNLGEVAIEKRVYEGVRLDPNIVPVNLESKAYQLAAARNGLGTDIAIRMGRNLKCVRFPLPENSLQKMADYLNAVNQPYIKGQKEYVWSAFSNNCAHLSANALATVGIRLPIAHELNWASQIFNLAIPYNGLVTLVDRTQYQSVELRDVYSRELDRKNFEKWGSIPAGLGALTSNQTFFKNNRVNLNCHEVLHEVPAKPLIRAVQLYREMNASFSKAQYQKLSQNAGYWLKRYKIALRNAKADQSFVDQSFRHKYISYLENRIDLAQQISRL